MKDTSQKIKLTPKKIVYNCELLKIICHSTLFSVLALYCVTMKVLTINLLCIKFWLILEVFSCDEAIMHDCELIIYRFDFFTVRCHFIPRYAFSLASIHTHKTWDIDLVFPQGLRCNFLLTVAATVQIYILLYVPFFSISQIFSLIAQDRGGV